MTKIIDAFLFFNELEMLEFHLHEMNDIVDYFIIGESEETFSGKAKPMLYLENASRYAKFADKIIHVPIKAQASADDAWQREEYQRDQLKLGFNSIRGLAENDTLLISDVDEIADHNTIKNLPKAAPSMVFALEQDIYYYNINTRLAERQCFTVVCSIEHARSHSLQEIRFRTRAAILRPGGWHFSYFGNASSILTKIQNFSHQDLNTPKIANIQRIETVMKNGNDLYGRDQNKPEKYRTNRISTDENDYLPKNFQMLIGSEDWKLKDPTEA